MSTLLGLPMPGLPFPSPGTSGGGGPFNSSDGGSILLHIFLFTLGMVALVAIAILLYRYFKSHPINDAQSSGGDSYNG